MSNYRDNQVHMIADYEGDVTELIKDREKGIYPILCTRDLVLFPTVLTPIILGRSQSVAVLEHFQQQKKGEAIFCAFAQKDSDEENPTQEDLYEIGVFCRLIKMIDLPGQEGQTTIVAQGLGRCKLNKITQSVPFYEGEVESVSEGWPEKDDAEFALLQQTLRAQTIQLIHACEDMPNEAEYALNNISNPLVRPNFIFSSMPFTVEDKMKLLCMDKVKDRIMEALKMENVLMQMYALQSDIRRKTKNDIDEQQREYFLQQQLKNIKEELGGNDMSPEKKRFSTRLRPRNGTRMWRKPSKKNSRNSIRFTHKVQTTPPKSTISRPWWICLGMNVPRTT